MCRQRISKNKQKNHATVSNKKTAVIRKKTAEFLLLSLLIDFRWISWNHKSMPLVVAKFDAQISPPFVILLDYPDYLNHQKASSIFLMRLLLSLLPVMPAFRVRVPSSIEPVDGPDHRSFILFVVVVVVVVAIHRKWPLLEGDDGTIRPWYPTLLNWFLSGLLVADSPRVR